MLPTGHSSEPLQGTHCPEQDGQTANQEAREDVTRLGAGTAPPDGSRKALLVTQHPGGVGGKRRAWKGLGVSLGRPVQMEGDRLQKEKVGLCFWL